MAINKAIIQIRRGLKDDLQFDKLLPGELAIATDAPCMWFCWAVGEVEQIPTSDNIEEVIAEIIEEYLKDNPVTGISEIYMRVYEGYIQYSSDGEIYNDLISVSELKGAKGDPGSAGVGIRSISQQTGNLNGGKNTIKIVLTNGNVKEVFTYNGSDANVTLANIVKALGFTPASEEFVNNQVSTIPKFELEAVDSLPTANIKETTVYLLKSGNEIDNLYTEYVYKNGKWEKLGAQTLDLSKYAEKSTTLKGYGITDGATKEEVTRLSQEIADEVEAREQAINDLKAQGIQQVPLYPEEGTTVSEQIEWLNEHGDTSKVYVLSDGYIYGYIKTTITTEGGTVPNFTNLLNVEGAYVKQGYRYSYSGQEWKENSGGSAYVVPIPKGTVTLRIKNYYWHNYDYIYLGTTNDVFTYALDSSSIQNNDHLAGKDILAELTFNNHSFNYATFVSKDGYVEIITANEEITYTTNEGSTVTSYKWVNTRHAFVPADYEDRIVDLENGLNDAENNIVLLREKMDKLSIGADATTAFSIPAYAPVPQIPADGSSSSDFNANTMSTQNAYDYMDALVNKYTSYIYKQTMGKDASGTYDHNRYILSKAYWRAWQKENYPKMYAWKNGSTVIYSVSISPRVGDSTYSTPYVGTVYNTVTSVNSTAGVLSTRTVNGLVFARYTDGDIEPTVVYTKVPKYPNYFSTAPVYNSSFGSFTTVSSVGDNSFVGADGVTYIRYPFEDRKADKTKLLSIFILSNEHGFHGDALIPSFVVMRMAKDLCKNIENPFLKWLKENTIITMIPVGNPWGYERYLTNNSSGYYNSNGININRNYDTPGWDTSDTNYGDVETFGEYAGSEVETQHIMNTMQLCKPAVGISMHGLELPPEYSSLKDNGYFIYQGCGFDSSRIQNIAETLYSAYSLGADSSIDQAQHYNNCGKSPAYIQYVGAVGGLTETICWEAGTPNTYTSIAMEQAYTQLLLFLQTWCEEAIEKMS